MMNLPKKRPSLLFILLSAGVITSLVFTGAVILPGLAASSAGPTLSIPSNIFAQPGSTAVIPISFAANGNQIASSVFSLDYDETWLVFDPGMANAYTFSLPASFVGSCSADPADTDGEIDCFILDPTAPLEVLPDSVVLTVILKTLNPSSPTSAAVGFSQNSPPASFGDTQGQSVTGNTVNGSVLISSIPAPRGFIPLVGRALLPLVALTPTPTSTGAATHTPTPTLTPTGTVTHTPTPTSTTQPPSCSDYIVNGGFESSSGWELPLTVYSAGYSTSQAHKGSRSMRTGIERTAQNVFSYSSARQAVSIPSNAKSADLEFWYYPVSEDVLSLPARLSPTGRLFENSPLSNDLQYVIVVDAYNNWIGTLLWQLSNSQDWTHEKFNLKNYAGMTIKIQFGTFNNGTGGVSAMYEDDVSLTVCR